MLKTIASHFYFHDLGTTILLQTNQITVTFQTKSYCVIVNNLFRLEIMIIIINKF